MSMVSKYMTEHHKLIDKLFDNYRTMRRGGDNKTLRSFNDISIQLLKHMDWEEEIFFPLFETRFNNGSAPTSMLRRQHIQIKEYLDKIKHELTEYRYNTEDLEHSFKNLLGVHNATEEYAVYSWIDDLMDDEEKQRLLLVFQNYAND
jgi:iron-sulfur cluster repair protein YtfE (RIC family)